MEVKLFSSVFSSFYNPLGFLSPSPPPLPPPLPPSRSTKPFLSLSISDGFLHSRLSCKLPTYPLSYKQGITRCTFMADSLSLSKLPVFFFAPVPVWVSSRLQVFWKTPSQSAAMGRRLMLCSQWHRREAEGALETKSRNSARAGGRRSRRHTHSFKHTLKERGDSHTHKHAGVQS